MAGLHAFLAPSAAGRWVKCALSARLEAAYPEAADSPASLEGTAAHWVVQRTLEGSPPVVGSQAPNGVGVTLEMLEAADLVIEAIEARLGRNWRKILVIERRVHIPRVHPTQCSGTPDYTAWVRLPNGLPMLFVIDFKYGHGVVEVFENWQLITYAAGKLDEIGGDESDAFVTMVVIQPRSHHKDGPVRQWVERAANLRAHINILAAAALKACSPEPTATPDPDACEHCRGRHACVAVQRSAYSAADRGRRGEAVELTPHALGLELRALSRAKALLEARESGLASEAEALIKQGQHVPFWSMESTPGRLAWNKPASEVLALGAMMGVDIAAPASPITPTQAKKAGLPDSIVNLYASRPAGAAKLVPDDGTKARLTFTSSNT